MTGRIQHPPSRPAVPPAPKGPTTDELANLASKELGAASVVTSAKTALDSLKLALASVPAARKPALQKQVDEAQARYDAAFDAHSKIDGELKSAYGTLRQGKGDGATKTNRMVAMYDQLITARDAQKPGSDKWKKLDAAANHLGTAIRSREESVLTEAKWDRTKATTEAEMNMDGLTDLASRTREEQVRMIGSPVVGISPDKAAEFDRKKVSLSLKGAFKEYGTQMLANQLEGADEAGQLKLLKLLSDPKRDHLSAIIAQAGEPNGANNQFLADAIKNAKGSARQLLVDKLAAAIDGPKHPMLTRLGNSPTFKGNFEVSGALISALKKAGKTEAAGALMGSTAAELRGLRGDFEKQKKVVDALNAEFARTVTGFASAVDPKAVEAYRDSFVKKHQAEFDAFEQTADRYMGAFAAAASGAFGEPSVLNPLNGEGKLAAELKAATKTHGEALLNTQSGQKALEAAMKLQLLKQPSFLDGLAAQTSKAKTYIELPQKMAEITARSMVRVSVSLGKDASQLNQLVSKNAKLLGISADQADTFNKALSKVAGGNEAERLAAYKQAASDLGGGDYGKSAKVLGLILAGPSLINGWVNIKDQNALGVVSQSVDTLGFATDAFSLFSDAKVLSAASKALGGAGAAISLVKGVMSLSEGKLLEGGTNLATAAGGALMLVPGGQLFGAALVIGATVANLIWGEDPAEDAEMAQQKNVKEFLETAGLRPEIASELSDVLQTNHRSVGPFIEQMAEHLGVKPSDFLSFLNGKDPKDVRALVQMVKNMPADKDWKFATKKTGEDDTATVRHQVFRAGGEADIIDNRPRSLETAKQWMRDHNLMPPGAK